ncbi:MAG TPA: DUF423 domain-containing protein [Alphaproteobacteria bacterium]|nr:DUF423 domain-containing protein [Alphaproteobacteria bacterium]
MTSSDEPPAWLSRDGILRATLAFAGLSGLAAIGLGAWSAHGARQVLSPQALEWVHTGVQYQAWHSIALLGVGILMAVRPGRFLTPAAAAFALGILLFSGSLYGLAFTGLRAFAYATPIGGIAMLAGWLLIAIYALTFGRRF